MTHPILATDVHDLWFSDSLLVIISAFDDIAEINTNNTTEKKKILADIFPSFFFPFFGTVDGFLFVKDSEENQMNGLTYLRAS